MQRTLVLPLVVCALLPGLARAGECPVDTLYLRNRTYQATSTIVTRDSAGQFSVVRGHPADHPWVFGLEQVEYDLASGSVHVTANSTPTAWHYCFVPIEAYARLRDTFTLFGPAGGAPCQLTIRLDLDVSTSVRRWYCCDAFGFGDWVPPGIAIGRLAQSENNFDEATFTGLGPHQSGLLSVEFTRAPGETFDLEIWARAFAQNYYLHWNDQCDPITADLVGSLSIAGLPEGYEVRSCQGFRAGTLVPVRSRSWGSIKTLYR